MGLMDHYPSGLAQDVFLCYNVEHRYVYPRFSARRGRL
jgi:hypothetical protein